MNDWSDCKHILCIRPDNMGDLLMSTPAIRALKETFGCHITVLTSSMASGIASFIPEIDDVLVHDLPWVKSNASESGGLFQNLIAALQKRRFDAAVIFTVYSQNPLPTVLLVYLAGIPKRLAYCRENPYHLLTHWVPDGEPYSFIQHQVRRDLALVATVGAATKQEGLELQLPQPNNAVLQQKLFETGMDMQKPWLILHAGVSENKREYPQPYWIETGRRISSELGYQVLLTGVESEKADLDFLEHEMGRGAYSLAARLSLAEFIQLIKQAPVVVSVNTATTHIAAAMATPVIVLYALTNPQHLPWNATGKVLLYDVPEALRSKNEIVRFVHEQLHPQDISMPTPDMILQAIKEVLSGESALIPQLIPLRTLEHQVF